MARPLISVVVVIAIQALAGCGMPTGGVAGSSDNPHLSKVEREARNAKLRKQIETGSLGFAQLFPGGDKVDGRRLAPLPSTLAVAPVRSLGVRPPRTEISSMPAQPMMQFSSAAAADQPSACVFKAVMSDADIDACRS